MKPDSIYPLSKKNQVVLGSYAYKGVYPINYLNYSTFLYQAESKARAKSGSSRLSRLTGVDIYQRHC